MRNNFKRTMFPTKVICALSIVSMLTPVSSVSATQLPPNGHAYANQHFNGPITGGYFSSTNGQEDLFSNWSTTNNQSFLTKEMWVDFNNSEWIEVGDVDGSMKGNYWAGHYEAYQRLNSSTGKYEYNEFSIGSSSPTGTHNYEIQYAGNNTWNVYVDYAKVDFWTFPYSSANGMEVGIESDDTGNTYTSGTYSSAIEYLDSTGFWKYWTSATNWDNNVISGWKSAFTYSNGTNKIVYTHN